MNLVVPMVGSEPGPNWANDLNSDLSILDGHNHTSGQGVLIPPAGLNINTDLSFQINNAILLRSVRFSAQTSPLALVSDVGCVYVSGNELYYNDVTGGNQVKITTNGSVNSGAGSISGLPSGTASAAYAAGTFTWQSATSTAANMDFASAVLRNNTANSKGLTLSPPSGMAADFSLTLPSIPAATAFMTLDNTGAMGAGPATANGITRNYLAPVGQQTSSSSGGFSMSGSSPVAVTNLSKAITTTGRPVRVFLQPSAGSGGSISVVANGVSSTQVTGSIIFSRGVTTIAQFPISILGASSFDLGIVLPTGNFYYEDPIIAGTYTYSVTATQSLPSGGLLGVTNCVLVVEEL